MERVDYEKVVVKELGDLHDRGELDLNPWYQRRSVWTRPQRAYLINTVFEQKPVPSIYIRHYLDMESERSVKEVVDGQQRIRALLGYIKGEFSARHPRHLNLVKYEALEPGQRREFLMTSLSVGYLIGADDADVIEIFGRLNSVSKTLNEQEKRNARYGGEMKQFCLNQAAQRVTLWRDLQIFSANDIARMNEVLFVSDLTLNMLQGLSDYSAASLNTLYRLHDEAFEQRENVASRLERVFSAIASLDPAAIKDTIFSRVPLFFTLCLVLDAAGAAIGRQRIEQSLFDIDAKFNSDLPLSERSEPDAEFYVACTASTQRIRTRQIRDLYVRTALGL